MKNQRGETFGAWLLAQKDRDGDPETVRKHLSKMQVEGDFFDAVDDAESDWLSYQ